MTKAEAKKLFEKMLEPGKQVPQRCGDCGHVWTPPRDGWPGTKISVPCPKKGCHGGSGIGARRVPVQSEGPCWAGKDHSARRGRVVKKPGTVEWREHAEAYRAYVEKYGPDQSSERLIQRGGFGYLELVSLLGREPETWKELEEKPAGKKPA